MAIPSLYNIIIDFLINKTQFDLIGFQHGDHFVYGVRQGDAFDVDYFASLMSNDHCFVQTISEFEVASSPLGTF